MKTTVAELVAKLLTLPQDAEVQVMGEVYRSWETGTEYGPVDLEFGVTVFDYSDQKKYPNMGGRVIVQLETQE